MFHGVPFCFVILMDLAVCPKGSLAVVFIIKTMTEDYFPRDPTRQNTLVTGKIVEPHHNKVEEMYKHHLWYLRVGEGVDYTATTLFDNSNSSLYFRNMLPGHW